jgi:hypothetical protein
MLASGKQVQHARGVCSVGGLAEKLVIILATNDNHGVGSEHTIMRTLTCNCERLLACQAFGTILCGFSGQRIFLDVRGLHFESDACVAQ